MIEIQEPKVPRLRTAFDLYHENLRQKNLTPEEIQNLRILADYG